MNKLLGMATAANFASAELKRDWAKNHLDHYTYARVEKSRKATLVNTTIFVVFLVVLFGIAVAVGTVKQKELRSWYDTCRTGRVLGETVYYIDNEKYEILLSDYGYDYHDFENRDIFDIYFNEEGDIIKIAPYDDSIFNEKNILVNIYIGGAILMIIMILCIYLPICYHTFGRDWRKYCRWFDKSDPNKDTFELD